MVLSCDCSWDGDYPVFFQSEIRTAAKTHKCVECGWEIRKGEYHEHAITLDNGCWYRERTCGFCLGVWGDACRSVGGLIDELTGGLDYHARNIIEEYGEITARALIARWPVLAAYLPEEPDDE